ncbi:AAA family ATPase [Marinilactibacillus sp. 15R]|uniref:MoxR-like ATPase n=1 Tax=Marinilactibacillus piezotolerans TaxID=258723 RepID=A0A1I3XFC3_9LACT|nr:MULTISPECIES: MoxR family ATPase [Marinilactibacillus]API88232.1 AAA family ATPase [Marinilactibacillus sp. 15R]SFK18228.1 MoxR-like ATPase [Marinilactibacillus piezotolerans]
MTFSNQTTQAIRKLHTLIEVVDQIVIGKKEVTRLTLNAMLASGHVLFEDIPGVGKTLLIKTISKCLEADFSRIQFTPDLIPSDIIGFSVPNLHDEQFEFRKGPIFNQIVLADEINRTSPRTQAAMLEAMSEKQVTLDGKTHQLPDPFFVLATQNPIDYEGTYPLPEAQLDRFLFQLSLGYPSPEQEVRMLESPEQLTAIEKLDPILSLSDFNSLKATVNTIHVNKQLLEYIVSLADASRHHPAVKLGISPRGVQNCLAAARSQALLNERDYVIPQDILSIVKPLFRHRLLFENKLDREDIDLFIEQLISQIAIPTKSRRTE